MFISKRKWEEMCERIDELEKIHPMKYEKIIFPHCDEAFYRESGRKHDETTTTNEISNITLEELARLVIDGTPITRKVMEENIKEYGRME